MDLKYRDPQEALWGAGERAELNPKIFEVRVEKDFLRLLNQSKQTIVLSREYEHFLLALTCDSDAQLVQTHFEIPHPSGLAWNAQTKTLVVASTRNPNLLAFFGLHRKVFYPQVIHVLPGRAYLHDVGWKNSTTLWLNSVGTNSILEWRAGRITKRIWSPPTLKKQSDGFGRNWIQLNSIALGQSLADSYFTSSTEKRGDRTPGDPEWPVDGQGVVWRGNGKVIARGLTRPHTARLHQRRLWVCNSGYGEFGWIQSGQFHALVRLPGWTRGVCFYRGYALVATSPVLERFESYAPGLKPRECVSGLHWVNLKTGKIEGSCVWPQGGQHFGVEAIPRSSGVGFVPAKTREEWKRFFFELPEAGGILR